MHFLPYISCNDILYGQLRNLRNTCLAVVGRPSSILGFSRQIGYIPAGFEAYLEMEEELAVS